MSRNDLKQTIVHRSAEEKYLLERLISDRVDQFRSTISGEAITAMKRGLLPPHEGAAWQVAELYSGRITLNQAVAGVFSIMEAGIGLKPRYNNALPLIIYAADMNRRNGNITRPNLDSDIHHDFLSHWSEIVVALESYADEDAHFNRASALIDVDKAKSILDAIEYNPAKLMLNDAFDLIIRNWNTLCNWHITYRTLACICVVSKDWMQDPSTRIELIDILTKMSLEWVLKDAAEAEEKMIAHAPRRMREIPMLNAHLIAPEEWIILNPDDALHSQYAYAVEIKSNEYVDKKFGPAPLPFFIYFSDNHVQREIYADCMALATKTWPPLKAILAVHVDFSENSEENDPLVNEVINESPNAAPYLIKDADKPYANHPYGAMIIRHK